MARKCTYCGNSGHNSRTCNNSFSHIGGYAGGLKLFGVQLDLYSSSSSSSSYSPSYSARKRNFSTDDLLSSPTSFSLPSSRSLPGANKNSDKMCGTYLACAIGHVSNIQDRNKGSLASNCFSNLLHLLQLIAN